MLVTSRSSELGCAGLGRLAFLFTFWLLPALLCAQWVDTTFYIPDSMTGLNYPDCLARNSVTHTLYVGGCNDNVVFAIDDRTGQKLARIPLGTTTYGMACDENNNLIYSANCDKQCWSVIDGASNRVVRSVTTSDCPSSVFVNPLTSRAYCGGDSCLSVIDGTTGQVVRAYFLNWDYMYSFALDQIDRKLYVATEETLLVFNALEDSLMGSLSMHVDSPSLAYNAANNRLYCACDTGVAIVDCRTDSVVKTLILAPDYWVQMLTVNRNGTLVCGLDCVGLFFAIDCTRDTFLWSHEINIAPGGIWFSPALDHVYCLASDYEEVLVADGTTGEELCRIAVPGSYTGFLGNPDDNLLYCPASTEFLGAVCFIDCVTNSVRFTGAFKGLPLDLCLGSELNRIYVGDLLNCNVSVIDDTSGRVIAGVSTGTRVCALAYNPVNDKVYCASSFDCNVTILSAQANEVIARVRVDNGPRFLVYNPANNRTYCVGPSGRKVIVIDGTTDQIRATIPVGRFPAMLCCSPAENKVYCTNYDDSSVSVVDGSNDSVIARVKVGRKPNALVYDATASKVYCASGSRDSVYVISGVTDSVIAVIPVGDAPISLAYSAAFDKVYCCNEGGNSVTVIDAGSDRVIATIPVGLNPQRVFCNPVSGLVYCANYGSDDVTVIQGANEQVLRTIPVQDGPRSIVANASGDRVYVANELRSSVSVLRDAGAVMPVTGLSGGTLFGHEMTLLGIRKAVIYDLSGRRRGDLLPGTNDLSGFAPGIYFVRFSSGRAKTAKIIIAR
jgi:YVTN family beta-propeller protein